MKKISEFTGITENLLAFREEVKDAEKITFIGMPGVCSPFALLFAYVVKEKESVFITGTDIKSAMKKDGKLIGLCYMDIFREYDWDQKLNFDCIINGTLNGFILRK